MERPTGEYYSDFTFENLGALPLLVVMDPDLQHFLIVGPQALAKYQQEFFTQLFSELPSAAASHAGFVVGRVRDMAFSGIVTRSDHAEPGTARVGYWLFWGVVLAPRSIVPGAKEFFATFVTIGKFIARAFDRPLSLNLSNEIDQMYISHKESFDIHKRRLMDAFEPYSDLYTLKPGLKRRGRVSVVLGWFNRMSWLVRPRFYCIGRVAKFEHVVNLYFEIWRQAGEPTSCVIWHEDIFASREYSAMFVVKDGGFDLNIRLFQVLGMRKRAFQKIRISTAQERTKPARQG